MTIHKALRDVELKAGGRGEVTAVFATLNEVDADGDVTLPGAFRSGQPVRISAWGHRSWQGDLPVGKGTIREVGNEAIFEGRFFLDSTHGRDTYLTVKHLGDLQEWSYSLENVVSERGQWQGRDVRFLKSISVTEVSPVLKGAGVRTRTLAVKGRRGDGLDPATKAELERIYVSLKARELKEEFDRIEAQLERKLRYLTRAYLELGYSLVERDFAIVGDSLVPEPVRKAAAATLSFCASELHLPARPTLKWFLPETPRDRAHRATYGHADWESFRTGENVIGQADRDSNTILVRADLDLSQTMRTVAHECRHLAQDRTADYVANERDARAYEADFALHYADRN